MPGIPYVYYGSEWSAKAHKSKSDPALRACFEKPEWNDLCEWIARLTEAKKGSKALNYDAFRSVVLTNKQCIFEHKCDDEIALVAINADSERHAAHFGGGSELLPYSVYFWKLGM